MKGLLLKFLALIAPFAILLGVELFVLPIDFFTFRAWEALVTKYFRPADGIFYPNMHLIKTEHADKLGFRDPNPKRIEWFTDRHGFRQRPRNHEPERYDIVIVGDSNIAGSYFDQKDTIAEVLERKCECPTYSYGGAFKRQLFNDPRFKSHPPRVIITEAIGAEFYKKDYAELNYSQNDEIAGRTGMPVFLAVLLDRVLKTNMLEFFRSRLQVQRKAQDNEPEFSPEDRIPFMVGAITRMRDEAARRGSDFIFILMPYDKSLDDGVAQLRRAGVKVIDYGPSSDRPHGVDLKAFYHEHDSHWREESARMTADEILKLLGWPNKAPETAAPSANGSAVSSSRLLPALR
jgi:alginate O-acetyltransferase complex protein AlgJ